MCKHNMFLSFVSVVKLGCKCLKDCDKVMNK